MMNGKRGFVFGLYLVLLTILMVGTVAVLYSVQQRNANGSLVSPVPVLQSRDRLENFEYNEGVFAENVFESVKGKGLEIGSDEFVQEFREEFLSMVEGDKDVKNFLLEGLVIDGKDAAELGLDREEAFDNFLENKVYGESSFYFEGDKLVISRSVLTKQDKLSAPSGLNTKIRFPVTFYFEFERTFEVGSA